MIAAASATGGKMSQPGGPRRLVLWFRNDLRLHDNPMVASALQKLKAKEVDDVSPRLSIHTDGTAPSSLPEKQQMCCSSCHTSSFSVPLCSSKRPTSAGTCHAITCGSRCARYLVLYRWCLCTAWTHASSRPRPGATSRRVPTGGSSCCLVSPSSCLHFSLGSRPARRLFHQWQGATQPVGAW